MTGNVRCKAIRDFGRCGKKPRWLGIFQRMCPEYGYGRESCEIADRPEPPSAPPPSTHSGIPEKPPIRVEIVVKGEK